LEKLLEAEIQDEVVQKKTNVKSKSTKTKNDSKQNPRQDEQILQPTQSQIAPLPVQKPSLPKTTPLSIPKIASPQASNNNECPSILEGTVVPDIQALATSIVCEDSIQAITNESYERNKKEKKKPDDKNCLKKVCGMTIPNLVLKPTKVLNQEMVPNFAVVQEEPQIPEVPILVSKPNLRTLENIRPNCDKDIPKTYQKPTSTPMERRRPLKNTFKDVSMITAPMSSDTTLLYTQE
jgi:hypothetical protein